MKKIEVSRITQSVKEMCMKANISLSKDVSSLLFSAYESETYPIAKKVLHQIIENIDYSKESCIPLCQDTGVAVFFVEIGHNVQIVGGTIEEAIQEGVKRGYKEGYLRNSMVFDPVFERSNTGNNTPAYIYYSFVEGDNIVLHFAPKGGGSENMSSIAMLKPAQGKKGINNFIIDTVKKAGGNPCPPIILGIGIGGTFEQCALSAKKSLLRDFSQPNPDPRLNMWEKEICQEVNKLGIGPMGLGGKTTVLATSILWKPCHIASMPVAINIQCHCARHAHVTLQGK